MYSTQYSIFQLLTVDKPTFKKWFHFLRSKVPFTLNRKTIKYKANLNARVHKINVGGKA